MNSTTQPCRSQIYLFSVVQSGVQNCCVCHVTEIVDDTLIVILFEYLHCQQGTLLTAEIKGLSLIAEIKGLSCVHFFLRASHRTLIAVI